MAMPPLVLVLGLGNLLWADDGFGVRAVEVLRRCCRFPAQVTLLDGGIQGLGLLRHVRTAKVLLVFDAIDAGVAPGSLVRFEDEAVPTRLDARHTSLHQGGFDEVLALAEALGEAPEFRLLIGVQPMTVAKFGAGLSPAVRRQLAPALRMALGYLRRFGVMPLRSRAAGEPR